MPKPISIYKVRRCMSMLRLISTIGAALVFLELGFFQSAHANASNDSVEMLMDHPATITARAGYGLFTSVARAGDALVAVGERGRVLRSSDDGQSWVQVETPTSVTLTDVAFANASDGWAVGQMGIVLHTSDGGLSWTKQYDGVQAANAMLQTAKADIAARGNNDNTSAELLAAQQMVGGGPSVPFLNILPFSSSKLFLVGAFGFAFTSIDGGTSWKSIAAAIPNPNGLHIYGLIDASGAIFAAGEQGLVLKGSFGGTYTAITTPFQGSFFGLVKAKDNSILVYGLQGTVLRSSDQGKSWQQLTSGVNVGIDCGTVLRNGNILLGDIAGDLLLSKDNGLTFSLSNTSEPVVGLAQAKNGSIVIAGPLGLKSLTLASISPGA